ncbi:MAG: L,D-transpeptidase family protein [Alphaproteobacteria bacterium]|nr:L,D-transpeptidase family protein [Alphaproteobacteria bacterium]
MPWVRSARAAPPNGKADWVLVIKSIRNLQLYRAGNILKTYACALGKHPEGPKLRIGDGRTPEGVYTIDSRLADSAYFLALHVSYPDAADMRRAAAAGVNPGGKIFIHGLPNHYKDRAAAIVAFPYDWTDGCISVDDISMQEIWNAVDDGTPIEIRP